MALLAPLPAPRAIAWSVALLAILPACTALLDFDGITDGGDAGRPLDASADAAGSAYSSTVLADAPLAYFRLGETDGVRARDETGRQDGAYFGVVTLGGPGAIPGDADRSMTVPGPTAAGGVSAGTGFGFPGAEPFTLEAWIRPDLVDAEYRHLWNRAKADAKGRQGYAVFAREGKIVFERHVDDVRVAVAAPFGDGARWIHVAATSDGSAITLYLDGAAVDTAADARPAAVIVDTLFLGAASTSAVPFVGGLDEAAVYGTALSPDRVRAHFEAGRGAK